MGRHFDGTSIDNFNQVTLLESCVRLATNAYDHFGFRNVDDGFLLFARADGEETLVVLDAFQRVDFGSEDLIVAVENFRFRTLLVEIRIRSHFLLLLLVLFAEVAEHVFEVAIAGVPFVTARRGNALRQVGISDSRFARSRLGGDTVTVILDAFAHVNGIARINPVGVLNVSVVFPKVRPCERVVQKFTT